MRKANALDRTPPRHKSNAGAGRLPAVLTFAKCFLESPRRVASLFPSSAAYAEVIATHLRCGPDECVVETGAGTGSVTKALLQAGVRPDRLFAVEVIDTMARYLRETLPGITVIEDDATRLPELLPEAWVGKVGTVVSGIPLSLLPVPQQRALIDAMFAVMPPGRRFLQLTHRYNCPVDCAVLGLKGERLGFTFNNIPPASVWGFSRTE